MKKMKLQMLGLSVNDLLSREQMKKVMGGSGSGSGGSGGGNCCAHTEGWTDSQCGYADSTEAQNAASAYATANHVRAFYCCDCPAH